MPPTVLRLPLLLALFALLVAATGGPAPVRAGSDYRLVVDTQPTNAAKVFRWGLSAWEDEFIGPLHERWHSNRPLRVVTRNGMLTLKAGESSGTVWASPTDHSARYGRWEARVRTGRVWDAGHAPYRITWELVPVLRYRCGAKSLVISTYQLGEERAQMYIRSLPDHEFTTDIDPEATTEEFHTFAVEVTQDHISWFVDTLVIMTERRPEALSGVEYTVRFRMEAQPDTVMDKAWMQMDWVRYYTLARPNAKSIEAPQSTLGTYAGTCPVDDVVTPRR